MADLPSEVEVLDARMGFVDAQAELTSPPIERREGPFSCGWYGTSISQERGSFAVVSDTGLLTDLIGQRVRILYGERSVVAYVFGGSALLTADIALTRRTWAALELLAVDRIDVRLEVMGS